MKEQIDHRKQKLRAWQEMPPSARKRVIDRIIDLQRQVAEEIHQLVQIKANIMLCAKVTYVVRQGAKLTIEEQINELPPHLLLAMQRVDETIQTILFNAQGILKNEFPFLDFPEAPRDLPIWGDSFTITNKPTIT